MKKALYILIFTVLSFGHIYSQERVYLSTDKNCYVAGDRVWCSAFCMDITSKPIALSNFSSTAYVELQTNSSVVQVAKLALIEGRGAGALELPADMPTGNYKLVAYTSQNKNEEGFIPEGKVITIFNTLSTERVENNVQASLVPAVQTIGEAFHGSSLISISTPKSGLKPSSELPLSIKNLSKNAISLSVSIYHQDSLCALAPSSIEDAFFKINAEPVGSISNKVLPDYEGEVIKLKTSNIKDGLAHVSFPGKVVDYYTSEVDSTGEILVFTPNIYGNKDMICEIVSTSMPTSWSIEIVDPYIKRVQGDIPQLVIGPYMEKQLLKRGFSMQLEHRFEADTLFQRLPVRRNTFLNGEKISYPLDHYTRFPLMEEVITEFVKEMRIRTVQKVPQILISNLGYSLMLLDGVPVFDHKKIINYDPLLVKEINIYLGTYSTGIRYYEGVACFNTYKGNLPSFTFSDNVKILPYKGSLVPLAFTGSSLQGNKKYPDYRQTIYWHPIIDISPDESFDFKCITPLYQGSFEIVIEGVSETGEPIFYKSTFSTL